jgi:hypothetical protein
MTAHEARYDLARLQDLLLARQEQAARVTTCATC